MHAADADVEKTAASGYDMYGTDQFHSPCSMKPAQK
jgi:hypothetical protein